MDDWDCLEAMANAGMFIAFQYDVLELQDWIEHLLY